MNTSEALTFLSSLNPSKMKFGLEPVAQVLEALGHPERHLRVIHVAGTNGKGSTCAFLHSCLRAHGHRVALYTSPHLVDVNERFQINGENISDDVLALRINEILRFCPRAAELTYFEFGTVLAFWHFFQEEVDWVVLETGLGGRLDATNCCVPTACVVTSISLDHCQYLGNTVSEISVEKAGIIKRGVPVVSARQEKAAHDILEATASRHSSPFLEAGVDFGLMPDGRDTYSFRVGGVVWPELKLGLWGPHQRDNAEAALGCLWALAQRGLLLDEQKVREGLLQTRWPGRLEWVSKDPPILVDGAHNLDGIRALMVAIEHDLPGRRIHLVFGVLADKDYQSMARALFPACSTIHLAPVESPRAVSLADLRQCVEGLDLDLTEYPSLPSAMEGAKNACQENDAIVVCGSLVWVGQLKRWIRSI